jgi:hypothetical protein
MDGIVASIYTSCAAWCFHVFVIGLLLRPLPLPLPLLLLRRRRRWRRRQVESSNFGTESLVKMLRAARGRLVCKDGRAAVSSLLLLKKNVMLAGLLLEFTIPRLLGLLGNLDNLVILRKRMVMFRRYCQVLFARLLFAAALVAHAVLVLRYCLRQRLDRLHRLADRLQLDFVLLLPLEFRVGLALQVLFFFDCVKPLLGGSLCRA